jgi:hypothetical protein
MGKNKEQQDVKQSSLISELDPRIAAIVRRVSGDKLDQVVFYAEDLILLQGKQPNRAIADSLETFKLVAFSG